MGFGNPSPIAELKRHHAQMQREVTERTKLLEGKIARVEKLLDSDQSHVPTAYVRAALREPSECAFCLSAYTECPVH